MAATKTTPARSPNGSAPSVALKSAKRARTSLATAAGKAKGPLFASGAAAAGLVGGLALGSRIGAKPRGLGKLLAPRRRVLGVPLGRTSGAARAAKALSRVASELGSATSQVSATGDEVRQVREQLDRVNRQSPVEVVLDGLTHRRGAHKRES